MSYLWRVARRAGWGAVTVPGSVTAFASLTGADEITFNLATDTPGYLGVRYGTAPNFDLGAYVIPSAATSGTIVIGGDKGIIVGDRISYQPYVALTQLDDPSARVYGLAATIDVPGGRPMAPQGITIGAVTGTSIEVTATGPLFNGGASVSDIVWQWRERGTSTWNTLADGTSAGLTATFGGLSQSTYYEMRCACVNAYGQSDWSDIVEQVTVTTSTPPNIGATVSAHPTGWSGSAGQWQHTVDAGSTALVVDIAYYADATTDTITAVTQDYGGANTAMTFVNGRTDGTSRVERWVLASPVAGSAKTVRVVSDNPIVATAVAFNVMGGHASQPFRPGSLVADGSSSGTSLTRSITVPGQSGDLCVAFIRNGGDQTVLISAAGDETELVGSDVALFTVGRVADYALVAIGSSTSLTVATSGSAGWSMIGGALQPA